ncbi:Glutathione peroxidase @ Thioredoxin peroxidase [hydrothermal vent metagenome]|uniref:Glutathione peroxidase @ Thioredoxin peroxidase n=1 Tax=hydrothermal vent metagenome TaxID=652676 RepID=A0A3B0UVZ1_9ZZZZ
MKKLNQLLFLAFILFSCGFSKVKTRPLDMQQAAKSSIYDFKLPLLSGDSISLATFKGKKLLIVNTASECGFTPQYEGLEKLYKQYGDKVTVIGFPANNFGGQEPGTDAEIGAFCKQNYGVTFPMFSKISVKGDDMAPIYQWLTQKEKNGWNEDAPNWNFCKYLLDENGNLLSFYGSAIEPMSDDILKTIKN